MKGSLDAPPIVIVDRRWSLRRFRPLFYVSVAVALPYWLAILFDSAGATALGPSGALGAVFALPTLWLIVWPPRLELSPNGIALRSGWRRLRWPWTAFAQFRPVRFGALDWVGFERSASAGPLSLRQQTYGALAGSEGVLCPGYELSAPELCDILTACRDRWAGVEAVPVAGPARISWATRAWMALLVLFVGRLDRRTYAVGMSVVMFGFIAARTVDWQILPWDVSAAMALYLGLGAARFRDLGLPPWVVFSLPLATLALGMGTLDLWPLLPGQPAPGGDFELYSPLAGPPALIAIIPGQKRRNRFGWRRPSGDAERVASTFS